MALTLYIQRHTRVHHLHPVSKLVAMLCLFFSAFFTDRPVILLPLSLLVLVLLWHTGALQNVRRLRALFVMVFTMALIIWALFYRQGPILFAFGIVKVTVPGLEFAVGMAMKLVTFLAIGVLFLSTTTIEEFSHALVRVGVPFKVGFTITLAFRLVPVFVDSALTVIQAQRSRGFDFEHGNLIERARRYVPVIVPVFIGALRRADGMAMALEARGFQRPAGRTELSPHRFGAADVLAVGAAALVTGAYVALWKLGYSSIVLS